MRKITSPAASLAVGLLLFAAAAARAEPGIFLGNPPNPPLVRISWSAVSVADGVVHAPSTAVILRNGGVTLLETYDGSPFLLQQFAGRPDILAVLSQRLARSRVFALDGTVCSSPGLFEYLGLDTRGVTVAPGAPLVLHWYSVDGRRTAKIEVRAEAGVARCSNEVRDVVGAAVSYLWNSAFFNSPPTLIAGFSPQAGALREVDGRIFCGKTSTAAMARVRLHDGLPYTCVPEACLPNHPPILAETVTGPDGRFRITVPAGASPELYLYAEPTGAGCSFEFGQVRLPDPPINSIEMRLLYFFNGS